jgi:VanZ family protein
MRASRYRWSLAVWVLLIAYASLYPFLPLRLPALDAAAAAALKLRYVVAFDVVLNILAYMPIGVLATLYFSGTGDRTRAIAHAVGFGAILSLAMETCQLFIPGRVASVYDLLANTLGTLAGAIAFADPFHSVLTRPLGRWREEVFVPGAMGDAGLMLVVLWLLAQLNPALPFFGAGNIAATGEALLPGGALDALSVALAIAGFGLFVSAVLRGDAGTLRVTLLLLSIALWLKFVAASVMLQPNFAQEWVTAARFAGLAGGVALLAPLRRLPRAGRLYLAILALLAGALISKIFGAYSAVDELLRLFRWPYGQLANFTTLTRFLHELWPVGALTFLIALFLRDRRAARAIIAR